MSDTITPNLQIEGESYPDMLEIIIFGKENIKHYDAQFDSTKDYEFKTPDSATTYIIRKKALLKKGKGFIDYLKRKRESYIALFNEDNPEPLEPDFTEPKVSSRIVYIALQSRTLSKGLLSIFKKPFSFPLNTKTVMFIIVIIAVAVGLAYAISTGALGNIFGGGVHP
jgi:hypothetical protein